MGLLSTLGLRPRVAALAPQQTDDAGDTVERGDDPPEATPVTTPPVVAKPQGVDATPPQPVQSAPVDAPEAEVSGDATPKSDYEARRDAAQKLLDELKAHLQKAHVAAEIASAGTDLGKAKGHADKNEWPQALADVEKARKTCVAGKGFADSYATYVVKRAEVDALFNAATLGSIDMGTTQAKATGADTKAAVRNYKDAGDELAAVMSEVGANFTKAYVTKQTPLIAAVKAKKAAKFIEPQITEIDKLQKEVVDAIAAKQWRKADLTGRQLGRRIIAAGRMADWRQNFDTQRPTTLAAITKLKAKPLLAAHAVAIDQKLAAADALAANEEMQIDDALTALRAIEASCATLIGLADGAAAYAAERTPADAALAALRAHKAAKQVEKEIAAIEQQLASAAQLAGDVDGKPRGSVKDDPTGQNFEAARGVVKQAVSDLAAAKKVADDLTGVVAVQAVAGASPPDAKAITKAVADLRKQAVAAAAAPHADMAKQQLDDCEAALKEVEAKLADKQLDQATPALTGASLKLVEARKIQVEHTRYVELHKSLEARRHALLPDPLGTEIKAKVDALKLKLDAAAAHDKAGAFADAAAVLHQAEAAAKEAEDAAAARKLFDKRSADQVVLINDGAYAAIKVEQNKLAASALAKANAFDFAAANKLLDTIDNRVEAAKVEKLAKDSPGDAKLVDACKNMLAKGGAAEVDALIQRLPNDTDKSVFEKIAKERFGGLTIEADAGNDAQQSLKQMCKLMAQVPADVTKTNPSLKKISRIAGGGASYNAGNSLVKMNSRPTETKKADFPAKPNRLPPREEACKPANDNPEDLFDFNMLHELAHSMDDANHFMAAREGQEAFGGWIDHGGKVEPIATAVADFYAFNATDAERKYVLDLVLGNVPVAPPRPSVDGDKWDERKKKVDDWIKGATKADVWSNQAGSEAIRIDTRIYHVAYPNRWVSYLASARKRGITGYQFRAPGEWFSELFAAYKLGKLKPEHPSAGWLSKLSI